MSLCVVYLCSKFKTMKKKETFYLAFTLDENGCEMETDDFTENGKDVYDTYDIDILMEDLIPKLCKLKKFVVSDIMTEVKMFLYDDNTMKVICRPYEDFDDGEYKTVTIESDKPIKLKLEKL